ncbi:Amino acid adenylation domain-containing protein OS=Streptomyces rimosus subsp. rimosus (strain ATCC / DSM 40260 / JCM 4667 / NRRL 2234) OX=1265868 GN=SRIM_020315 PE=4 SV=1 [Streptomyces rimosus subsp. rimosus]
MLPGPGTRLGLRFDYAPDLYGPADAERFGRRLLRVLEAIAADPEQPLGPGSPCWSRWRRGCSRRPGTPWPPRHRPVRWPRPSRSARANSPTTRPWCAATTPSPTAELNARANRLARALLARGAGPGRTVATRAAPLHRTWSSPLLAVLKSGAAYLPVDPAHPAERITFLLADTRPVLALTATATDGQPADAGQTRRAVLDDAGTRQLLADASHRPDLRRPRRRPDPSDRRVRHPHLRLHGPPKGVVISHRNVVRLLTSTGPLVRLRPGRHLDRLPLHAFDFAVRELFGPLLSGARLALVPTGQPRARRVPGPAGPRPASPSCPDPARLRRPVPPTATPDALRDRRCGRSSSAARRSTRPGSPSVRPASGRRASIVNLYGPTETTVHVTYAASGRGTPPGAPRSSGRPSPTWRCTSWTTGCGRSRPA